MTMSAACQLLFKAETQYFTPGSLVGDMREQADRLMIVSNGSLDLFVYACDRVFQLNKTDVSPRPSEPVLPVRLHDFDLLHLESHTPKKPKI